MIITVYDFVMLLVDDSSQKISLWDVDTEETVFEGFADEIPSEYIDSEIYSIDCIEPKSGVITLNIHVEEE